MAQKTITVSGADTSLFHVAFRQYNDPTAWYRIAQANGLSDPVLSGVQTLTIPSPANTTDGVPPQ